MPPKRTQQQQQQQQRAPPPQQQQPRPQSVIGLPAGTEEMADLVHAWFAARVWELPALEQCARGRSLAIRLARQFNLRDCYEAVIEADSPVIARVVAALLKFAAPAWRGQPLAETPLPGGNGTLSDALTAAGVMAQATAFAVAPSAPRPESPPLVPPVPDPRVEVLSPSPARPPPPGVRLPPENHRPSQAVPPVPNDPLRTNGRQPSLWEDHVLEARTNKSAGRSMTPGERALAVLARQQEVQDGTFDTHTLAEDDIFSPGEIQVLSDLPRFVLIRKEENFGATKRALQEMAAFIAKYHTKPQEIRSAFSTELNKGGKKSDVCPLTNIRLTEAIGIVSEPTVPRPIRLAAMATIALLWLQIHPDHYSRVRRLEIARLSARPADATEVASWLAGKSKVVTAPDFALSTSTSGF